MENYTADFIAEHLLNIYRITEMDEEISKDELAYAIQQAAEECGE